MGVVKAELERMNQQRMGWKKIMLTPRQRMVSGGIQRRPDRTPTRRLGMARMSQRKLFR